MAGESLDVVNDFDAWAAVSAKLLGRSQGDVEHLLLSLGVAAAWPTADAFWSRTIARDLTSHQLERVRRYAEKCAQELERRRKGKSNDRMEITELASVRSLGQSYEDFRAVGATGRAASAAADSVVTARMDSQVFASIADATMASATMASPGVTMASAGIMVGPRASPSPPPVVIATPTPPPVAAPAAGPTAADQFADDAMETQLDGPAGYVRKAWRAADEMLEWPLDKWATLCAELAERPDVSVAIYERHGLMHDEARRHVQGRWEERLQRDPLLSARFHALLDQERARMRSRRDP